MNIDKDIDVLEEYVETQEEYEKLFNMEEIEGGIEARRITEAVKNVLSDRETWQKIAEKLAKRVEKFCDYEDMCFVTGRTGNCTEVKENKKTCVQCIISWAKSEVDK